MENEVAEAKWVPIKDLENGMKFTKIASKCAKMAFNAHKNYGPLDGRDKLH